MRSIQGFPRGEAGCPKGSLMRNAGRNLRLHIRTDFFRKITAVIPHPSKSVPKSRFCHLPPREGLFCVTIACRVISWSWKIPPQIKKPLFPCGNKDRKYISAVPPCLPDRSDRSVRCQHTGCPLTLAMRQKILRRIPFPLPSAAHLLLRFSRYSQLCNTLCGCAGSFTSASMV